MATGAARHRMRLTFGRELSGLALRHRSAKFNCVIASSVNGRCFMVPEIVRRRLHVLGGVIQRSNGVCDAWLNARRTR
jgi:hypothetical protein